MASLDKSILTKSSRVCIIELGNKGAEYVYDAWGNCTIVSDYNGYGARNPFRYRGYYWDDDKVSFRSAIIK